LPSTPRFRTIICADVAGFSESHRTRLDQAEIRVTLYQALEETFTAANVPWTDCHREDRGDGVLIIAAPDIDDELLITTIARKLTRRIDQHNRTSSRAGSRFRLRVAVHTGRVSHDANGVISDALILTVRMLESEQLKSALTQSESALTFCASDYLYNEVVRHTSIAEEFQKRVFTSKKISGDFWIWPRPTATRSLAKRAVIAAAHVAVWIWVLPAHPRVSADWWPYV
jgi:hypothetical protein